MTVTTINRTELLEKFIEIIRPFVRNEAASKNINESTLLVTDLRVNSARLVDIILETEDRFAISIDDESADRMKSVGDAIDVIVAKLSAK